MPPAPLNYCTIHQVQQRLRLQIYDWIDTHSVFSSKIIFVWKYYKNASNLCSFHLSLHLLFLFTHGFTHTYVCNCTFYLLLHSYNSGAWKTKIFERLPPIKMQQAWTHSQIPIPSRQPCTALWLWHPHPLLLRWQHSLNTPLFWWLQRDLNRLQKVDAGNNKILLDP